MIKLTADAQITIGPTHKFTDPKLWRNVPQCVVDCCSSLIERVFFLDRKSLEAELNLVEAERKLKSTLGAVNAAQKCDLGELRSLLEAKLAQQVDQIMAKCAELAEVDSHLEREIKTQQLSLKELKSKLDVQKAESKQSGI